MPASANLFTTGILAKAIITSATSEATGFPKENLLDFNPDTFWKPTSTANQTIDIDLGAVQTVDQFAIWIHNYDTDYESGTQTIAIGYSTDDSSDYSGGVTQFVGTLFNNTVGQPIYFPATPSGPISKRYWRFLITNMTAIAEISQIFLVRKRAITIGNQFPEPDADKFYNNSIALPGGRKFTAGINSKSIKDNVGRTYILEGTVWTSTPLYLAHQDCKGVRYPLILSENSDYKLVHFTIDTLSKNKIGHLMYNPFVIYREAPHIADGESY